MSFILTDTTRDDHDIQLNAWHWRTILAILESLATLPKERIEIMGISGACPTLSQEEARTIARTLREQVIPLFAPDDRIFIDGTVTKEPDDEALYRDEKKQHQNYSTNGEVLRKLCAFCESCGDFIIY